MAHRASRITQSVLLTMAVIGSAASPAHGQDESGRHGPIVHQFDDSLSTPEQVPIESDPVAESLDSDVDQSSDVALSATDTTEIVTAPIEARPLGLSSSNPSPIVQPANATSSPPNKSVWWLRTALALGLVISLILLLRAVLQRLAGAAGGLSNQLGAGGRAPSGVLEVLGRFPVARGHTLVLLKMDRRILLLGQTASGFTPLSEINDPDEVASLLIKTRDEEGQSMTARFNSILHEAERDQGLLDEPISIVDRDPEGDDPTDGEDPAASLRHRLLGLRGLEA